MSVALRIGIGVGGPAAAVRLTAIEAEKREIHRLVMSETTHDPFVQLAYLGAMTSRIELMTGVAIAFARTPMTLAYAGWTLAEVSEGRAVIGVGSQIKTHIEHRFGMPWGQPAARMREFLLATREIWANWQDGARLFHRGEFYKHSLMTPMFSPPPLPAGPPRLILAAVGPLMSRVAGQVADGIACHPFGSPSYLSATVLPEVATGRDRATPGVDPARPFEVTGSVYVATGDDEAARARALVRLKERIAFYASTPAYAGVLTHHGWGDLQPRLHGLSLDGQWQEMGTLITDDMADTFGIVGTPGEVAAEVHRRFAGVLDQVSLLDPGDEVGPALLDAAGLAARHTPPAGT